MEAPPQAAMGGALRQELARGRALRLEKAGGANAATRKKLGKLHIWEVAAWENILGKLPLGKTRAVKYLNIFDVTILYAKEPMANKQRYP